MTAAAAVEATTQGQGKITSAVVMARVDMVVAATEAAMASRVDMEAVVVAMEETEADILEEDMVVAAAEEVEGGIRNHETG